jgi:hypothetical protein
LTYIYRSHVVLLTLQISKAHPVPFFLFPPSSQEHLSSATEATGAPNALLEFLDFHDLGVPNALNNELGDAVTFLHLEVLLAMVEEKYLYLATVVGINDTCAGVDEVLRSETRSGRNTAVLEHNPLDMSVGNATAGSPKSGFLHVPAGIAMLISVSTRALPLEGITVSLEA